MDHIGFITGNLVLDLAILAWFLAQLIKTLIYGWKAKALDWHYMVGSGGMPSSHSAFVCAVAASIGRLYGWREPLFALAAVVSLVVMYDACHVRRAAGEQAKILNHIMGQWTSSAPGALHQNLKELLGHTPFQVLMGAALGILVGVVGSGLGGT